MTGPRIVVVGSANTDMIVELERLPQPGETMLGGAFATAAGGKGANQAVAAARAGGNVTFIARVGDDSFGRTALAGYEADSIDISQIVIDAEAPSGVALIYVAQSGENSIAVAGGANDRLAVDDVLRGAAAFVGAGALLLQLETPLDTVEEAARIAAENDCRVILNPAPARALPASLLRFVDILTPNETEAGILTGLPVTDEDGAGRAALALLEQGIPTVIVTLGARGVLIAHAGTVRRLPGFSVEARDTTAAGDVFNGTLAVALSEGRTLDDAVSFANAAAALSVQHLGAQTSAPVRAAIDKFLGDRTKDGRSR